MGSLVERFGQLEPAQLLAMGTVIEPSGIPSEVVGQVRSTTQLSCCRPPS